MSHVVESKQVPILDLTAAEAAFKRIGGTMHRGQKTYKWYGRWVGDTAAPPGYATHQEFLDSLGKCSHAVSFPGAGYEVGIVEQPDGSHKLQWDYYGPGGLMRFMGDKEAGKFQQAYALECAKREIGNSLDLTVGDETELADGEIELEIFGR